jgi:hypothetical protein
LAPSVGEVFISLLVVGALVAGVGLAAWVLLARLASLAIFANSFASAAGPATLAGADVATGAATLAGADVATGAATLAGADVATGAATLAGATGLTLFFFSSAAFLSTSFLAAACFFFAKSAFAFFRSAFDAPQAELISKLQYFNQVALKQFLTAAWRCYSLLYFLAILMTLLQTALLIFIWFLQTWTFWTSASLFFCSAVNGVTLGPVGLVEGLTAITLVEGLTAITLVDGFA